MKMSQSLETLEKYSSREAFLLIISKSHLSSIPLFTPFSHPTTLLFNSPPFFYPGQCCQIPASLLCHSRQKNHGELGNFMASHFLPQVSLLLRAFLLVLRCNCLMSDCMAIRNSSVDELLNEQLTELSTRISSLLSSCLALLL